MYWVIDMDLLSKLNSMNEEELAMFEKNLNVVHSRLKDVVETLVDIKNGEIVKFLERERTLNTPINTIEKFLNFIEEKQQIIERMK